MEWKRISEEIESRGKIKTRGFALRFVKPVCSCVQVPWLVRPAHLKLPEVGSEKTGSMILSLLESCIFLSQNFYFSPCLKFRWYLQFEVKRVTLGLSPKKETMKATVHNLCKMCYRLQWSSLHPEAAGMPMHLPSPPYLFNMLLTMAFALGFWEEMGNHFSRHDSLDKQKKFLLLFLSLLA